MTEHAIGTREEWLAARLELLDAEKELTRRSDELARRRQELPWVRIEKEYRFETDEGPATLADLFQGRSQLLVYQFMFGPDYTAGCPSCSAIADGFNGSAFWEMTVCVCGGNTHNAAIAATAPTRTFAQTPQSRYRPLLLPGSSIQPVCPYRDWSNSKTSPPTPPSIAAIPNSAT